MPGCGTSRAKVDIQHGSPGSILNPNVTDTAKRPDVLARVVVLHSVMLEQSKASFIAHLGEYFSQVRALRIATAPVAPWTVIAASVECGKRSAVAHSNSASRHHARAGRRGRWRNPKCSGYAESLSWVVPFEALSSPSCCRPQSRDGLIPSGANLQKNPPVYARRAIGER
jgi:hypothetical protein